jgi:putative FmdB family regulatory protein
MPLYEYQCKDCGVIEIFHGMKEDNKSICPECKSEGLTKMISAGSGIIIAGREANQYGDIHAAKYWRDKNGVRHAVTAADGHSTSATVNKQTATPAEAKARTKADRKVEAQKRMDMQANRAKAWNKEQVRKADSWGDGTVSYQE